PHGDLRNDGSIRRQYPACRLASRHAVQYVYTRRFAADADCDAGTRLAPGRYAPAGHRRAILRRDGRARRQPLFFENPRGARRRGQTLLAQAPPAPMKRGKFITIEGGEGVGKSTQIGALRDWLSERGFEVVLTREP